MSSCVCSQAAVQHESKNGSRVRDGAEQAAGQCQTPAVEKFLLETAMDEFKGNGASKLKNALRWLVAYVRHHCLRDAEEDSSQDEEEGVEDESSERPTEVRLHSRSYPLRMHKAIYPLTALCAVAARGLHT